MISSHGRRVMAMGLTILVLGVSVGISFGRYGLLLGLLGVLAGANHISVSVNMTDDGPAAFSSLVASIMAYVRGNVAAVGLVTTSSSTMSSHNRRVMVTGLTILVFGVSVGISFSGYGLVLGLLGVLAGANLISVSVNLTDDGPAAFSGLIASITAYVQRNVAAVGLVTASSAVTAVVAGDLGPVLCFTVFTLLLLGISLVTLGVTNWSVDGFLKGVDVLWFLNRWCSPESPVQSEMSRRCA